MRVLSVILASAVAGAAVGAAVAYIEVRPTANLPASGRASATATASSPVGSHPRVEIDNPTHDFGAMQRGTTKSHEFLFRNVGNGPLTLRVGATSCKCTLGDVPDKPLMPGESVPVRLEWKALVNPGPMRQTASILTNDPVQSHVDLSVVGNVTEATGVSPPDFLFDKVTAGQPKTAEVFVMALLNDELEVGEPTVSEESMEQFFDVRVEPAERSELPNPAAKQGVKISVTAKPGLPLGRFDQWLTVPTNIPDAETLEIPMIGRVVGNISVHGRLWNEYQGVLRLGHVKSHEGARETLNLVVRGEGAADVEMSVAQRDPPELVAKLGEPRRLRDTLLHVPLVIEVPPGTPPMARLSTEQNDDARVVIHTTHPDAAEMVIRVRFAVER